jgi:hypothetical protein
MANNFQRVNQISAFVKGWVIYLNYLKHHQALKKNFCYVELLRKNGTAQNNGELTGSLLCLSF